MDAFYKQIHMNTQCYIASQTSQGCISFVVLHVFALDFGVDFLSHTEVVELSSGGCMATFSEIAAHSANIMFFRAFTLWSI